MRIGVPTEVKNHEYRVAITPAGVAEFVRRGHEVVVQAGAGQGSAITDDDFSAAGATILPDADGVWQVHDFAAARIVSSHAAQPKAILLGAVVVRQFVLLDELLALASGHPERIAVPFERIEELRSVAVFPRARVHRAPA